MEPAQEVLTENGQAEWPSSQPRDLGYSEAIVCADRTRLRYRIVTHPRGACRTAGSPGPGVGPDHVADGATP
jgi:hypothetical protein